MINIGRRIDKQETIELAKEFDIEWAGLMAFIEVESNGYGFYPKTNEPVVLFEGHWFHKFTKGIYDVTYYWISYPEWNTKWYYLNQRIRVEDAFKLNEEAALMSASWGKMQVMGFNYRVCGYTTIFEFVKAMFESEKNQIRAGLQYLKHNNLIVEVKKRNWRQVAYRYNGKGYEKNKYHIKLEAAFNKYSQIAIKDGIS